MNEKEEYGVAEPSRRRLLKGVGALGGALALFGVLVLTGLDKRIEAVVTAALPDAWVDMIVRF